MSATDVTNVLLKLLDVANPLAGTVATFIAGKLGLSETTTQAIQDGIAGADPVKLRQIAADLKDHLAQYNVQIQISELQTQSAQVESINKTLQTEAMGGSFWQRNHHAFESSFSLFLVAGIYILLPILKVPVPSVDPTVWLMIGGILGVTAWQRGEVNKTLAGN